MKIFNLLEIDLKIMKIKNIMDINTIIIKKKHANLINHFENYKNIEILEIH